MPFIEQKAKAEYKDINGKRTLVITPECEVTLKNLETGQEYMSDEEADNDPSWITLDEICGMSLVTLVSQGDLFPLIAGFLVFRASDILKKPNIVGEMEKYPGKIGVLYDDLAAGTIGLISALIVNQVMFITL